jgi:uncharacterized protein YggL (DUF469 family)
MKKRLRKKLRRGEFQELGFEVRFRAVDDLSGEAFDNVADAFISQAIEANGLICGGGGKKPEWEVFVTLDRRGSATETHRQAVQQWLATRPEVTTSQVGPLVDAWYTASPTHGT